MIIDSHCHLDYSNLYDELDDVVKRAELNQVKHFLTICTTLQSFKKIKFIIKKYKNIYGTFGIHPHETANYKKVDLKFSCSGSDGDYLSPEAILCSQDRLPNDNSGIIHYFY